MSVGRFYISYTPEGAVDPLYVTFYAISNAQPVLHPFVPNNRTQQWTIEGDAGNNIRRFKSIAFGNYIDEDDSDPAATQGTTSSTNWGITAVGDAWRVSIDADDSGPYWFVRESSPYPLLGLDDTSFSTFRFVDFLAVPTSAPDSTTFSSTTSDTSISSSFPPSSSSTTSPPRTPTTGPGRNPGATTDAPGPTTTSSAASRFSKSSLLTLSILFTYLGLVMTV